MAPVRPETISPPFPRPADGVWRAPSSRFHSLQLDRDGAEPSAGGLWAAATTLGVIVFFGRVTAVLFLCSCMYGARWLGAARADARGGIAGGSSSRRLGDRVALDYLCAEEHKVVACGLLDRAGGKRPSSRFCTPSDPYLSAHKVKHRYQGSPRCVYFGRVCPCACRARAQFV
ncbi:hypothetical protein ACQJBY_006295 [Aegilops geniculata]